MKVIFYQMPDGGVQMGLVSGLDGAILPAIRAAAHTLGLTEDDALNAIAKRDMPENCQQFFVGTVADLPNGNDQTGEYDATFRDAFVMANGKITVDMERARIIHMASIRKARDEKLKELDIKTMQGIDVQAQKQVLRDLPETFVLTDAKTPEELKQLWPEELA